RRRRVVVHRISHPSRHGGWTGAACENADDHPCRRNLRRRHCRHARAARRSGCALLMLPRFDLAVRLLTHNRLRLLIASASVAMGVVIIFVELGLLLGMLEAQSL